ncbi:MAG: capsule assembly Wzi family protein [Longimicrobiales bacterium]
MNTRPETLLRTLALALAAAGALSVSTPAAAQAPISVPSGHWVYPLLDRMAADGLLHGVWMAGRRPMDARAIGAALDTAAARAAGLGPAWAETAGEAAGWFRGEYGIDDDAGFRALPTAGLRAGDGPRTDPTGAAVGARLLYRPAANVGLWADPTVELTGDGLELPTPRLGAAWRPGPFRIAGTYDTHRLGPGAGGGIVLHDRAALPWLDVALEEPVILPWLLRYLGPFQISASASGIAADSLGPDVVFFTGEFRLQPFPWITLRLHQSAVVVEEVDGQGLSLNDIWLILQGSRSGIAANFDDQKASMSASLRLRLADITVNPYAVWGWEDTWEIDEDPGTILGVWLPGLPVAGMPLGLRYEYTAFGEAGMIIWPWTDGIWQHRSWYRHSRTRDRYVDGDGRLLGHPLGGYGTEHRLEIDAPLPSHGLLVRGALFTRERIAGVTVNPNTTPPRTQNYSNLLYGEMPGRSWGGVLSGVLTAGDIVVDGKLGIELGDDGWSRTTASLRAAWLLP